MVGLIPPPFLAESGGPHLGAPVSTHPCHRFGGSNGLDNSFWNMHEGDMHGQVKDWEAAHPGQVFEETREQFKSRSKTTALNMPKSRVDE
jgi:hypothetical protein